LNSISDRSGGAHVYKILFFLSYATYYGIYCLFLSFMVTYLTQSGYSPLFCGVAGTAAYLIGMVTQPIAGYITDAVLSLRHCLIILCLIAAGSSLWMGPALASPLSTLLCVMLISACTTPLMSLLDVWAVSSEKKYPEIRFSFVRSGGSLGYGALSFVMGAAVHNLGIQIIFPVQTLLCVLLVLLLLGLPKGEANNQTGASPAPLWRSVALITRDRRFCMIVTLLLLYWLTHRVIGGYLALLVDEVGGDTGTFGVVTSAGAFAEIVIPLFFSKWIRSQNLKRLLWICLCTNLVRPLSFFLAAKYGLAYLIFGQIIQSLGFSIYFTASIKCLSQAAPEQIRNTAISLGLAMTNLLGTVLANLWGGILINWFGTMWLIPISLLLGTVTMILYAGCAGMMELTGKRE